FPTSFILFPFLSWLCGMIYQRFEQEPIRLYALTLGGVLLLDAIPFFFYKFIQRLQVSTGIWFVHVELFTILFHIVAYAGYHYLSNYMAANERVDLQQGRGQLRRRVRRLRPMGK
ncbi:MAG: hypothetical protein J6D18_01010, partial [Erysipelotrichaceae bacterium]|nr:hypothetical protein [Erysipelotrichaceae bacterium]